MNKKNHRNTHFRILEKRSQSCPPKNLLFIHQLKRVTIVKELGNFHNEIYILRNLVVSPGALQVSLCEVFSFVGWSCNKGKKERNVNSNKRGRLDFLFFFYWWVLIDHVIMGFEGNEVRPRSIKNMLPAPSQTMNLTGHGELERDKDSPIYKYKSWNAKKIFFEHSK